MAENTPRIVKTHDVHLDTEYVQWIHDIKERYRGTQIKAAVKVNSEQLLFNWELGTGLAFVGKGTLCCKRGMIQWFFQV